MYYGIGKGEIKVRDTTEVLKYYEPFLESDKYPIEVFVIKNTGENSIETAQKAINEFSVPRTFIKNRENGVVYDLDCFEDTEANVNEIKNGTVEDYVVLKNDTELIAFQNFINNDEQAALIHSNNVDNTNSKKYDIYISYATFLGKKLRKRTLSVLNLNDINKVVILDLSFSRTEGE
ncbi:hypothetical protein GCM10007424_07980 [Flavobacterium suaedae]|uniref:Uncharacterized protein n=2 Tax=Flavobacterium suaedae TaxID=1767027 RepID=A0ABQ1JJ93_9FLAO|nr:hypothetical protein GCM10007424_07980 [Flavobacterium suaedae]